MTEKGKEFVVLADNSIVWIKREIEVIFIDGKEIENGND